MSNDKYYIPKYTDEPEKFLFCTVDELLVGSIFFMSLAWIGYPMIGAGLLIFVVVCMKRIKNLFFKDGLDAFLYWNLPGIAPLDMHLPKSCDREFLG